MRRMWSFVLRTSRNAVSHADYKKHSRARIACNILSVRIFGLFIVLKVTAVSRIELRRRVFRKIK